MRVVTMDAELEFAIQPSTTGKQLFDQVMQFYFYFKKLFVSILELVLKDNSYGTRQIFGHN